MNLQDIVGTVQAKVRQLSPRAVVVRRRNAALRRSALARLAAFSREGTQAPRFARVLVDGQWDNANHWLRYAMFRRALGLARAQETGLYGRWGRERVGATFAAFGISDAIDFGAHYRDRSRYDAEARTLIAATGDASQVLGWKLPFDFPAAIVYDGILKRQQRGSIDLADPLLVGHVSEALSAIASADALLQERRFDLVVLSHIVNFSYAAIAWAAVRRGIPVIALYGDYGVLRMLRVSQPGDLFTYPTRPSAADLSMGSPALKAALAKAGRDYLAARLGGKTADTSAIFAFRKRAATVDRTSLCERYGWPVDRPIVGVYAPNWYDFPHISDAMPYADFVTWMKMTIDVARERPQVSWLFKAHPCDEYYGAVNGVRLTDLLAAAARPHLQLCDASWNGSDILASIDGAITCHGTVGMEGAFLGKPVLVPYPGWYGDFGLARVARSPEDYRAMLGTPWWTEVDVAAAAERAALFAGWYFCVPDWHGGYALEDDNYQDAIFWNAERFLQENAVQIAREMAEIAAWTESGDRYYHIHKMRRAQGYQAPARGALGGVGGPAIDPRFVAALGPPR